eukprot:Tamp_26773.p1 GENE.Tamp_26773~~Tamp_26773.p1  ORF type:complete len:231 (-),score=26.86 Tamp_26773:190-828(-)
MFAFACCDCRKDDDWTTMKAERRAAAAGLRPQQQAPEAKAGVGLVFKPSFDADAFMALVVHDILHGSSAHQLGNIQRGDILQAIDGVDVFKRPAQEVSGLLLGARDTSVRVSLFRELTPEKAQSLQGQDLTYPQHFVSSRRVFELYSVVAKRSVPIDTGVGTHFPANASPAAQHASQRFSSPRPHSLAPPVQPLASPGRMRGIDAQSDISFR